MKIMIFIIVIAMIIFTTGTFAVADDFQKLNMKLYVNEMEVDAPVYAMNDAADESNIYVDLIAVFEKLKSQIKWDPAGIVYISNITGRVYNLKIIAGESIFIYESSTFTGLGLEICDPVTSTVTIEGRVFIRFHLVAVLMGGGEINENEIHLYSKDFQNSMVTSNIKE